MCRNRHTVSVLLLRLVAILLRQYFRDTGSHLVTIQSPLSHFLGEEARLTRCSTMVSWPSKYNRQMGQFRSTAGVS